MNQLEQLEHHNASGVVCAELSDLKKSYSKGNVQALNGVSLSINQGEIFGLIGPNGSGKTTMIGCLLGLLRPDSGKVLINGKSPEFYSVHKMIGYMPERPDFEHWMTGRQFLEFHHELAGKDRKTRRGDVDEALSFVELDHSAWERRLKTYSRGMLQRLNLAQLMLGKAQLLLMDEPTLGLDPNGVAVVRKFIDRARAEKVTAIINSHQLDEIERLCDRVAFIKRGQIAAIEKLNGEDFCDYVLCVRFSADAVLAASPRATDSNNIGAEANTAKRSDSDAVIRDSAPKDSETKDAEHRAAADSAMAGSETENHTRKMLTKIAESSNSKFQEKTDRLAKFVVKDGRGAGHLIRDLVTAGYLVEEAVPERSRLEQLFLDGGERKDHVD